MLDKRYGFIFAVLLLATGWMPAGSARGQTADEKGINQEIALILEHGWSDLPEAYDQAERRYQLAKVMTDDGRPEMAMALVAIKFRRLDLAQKLLDSAVVKDRANLDAWRANIWLRAHMKDYAGTLIRLKALVKLYPPGPTRPEIQTELEKTAGWLGNVFGFLTGPVGTKADPERLEAERQEIVEKLISPYREAFEQGTDETLKKHAELEELLQKYNEEDLSDVERSQNLEQRYLEKEQETIEEQMVRLEDSLADLKVKFDATITEIDEELQPLVQQYQVLLQQARPMQLESKKMSDRIQEMLAAARQTRNSSQQRKILDEADHLDEKYDELIAKLEPIEKEGRDAERRITELTKKRAVAVATFQQQSKRIQDEMRRLKLKDRRIDQNQRQTDESVDLADTPRIHKLYEEIHSVETYREFPLDQVKNELLQSLAAPANSH